MFARVLNYLRYGSIELPESIPEAMFKRELDYYGIPENDGSVVQWKKKTLGQIMKDVKYQDHCLSLAIVCFEHFRGKSVNGQSMRFSIKILNLGDDCRVFWNQNSRDQKALKTLSEYLEYFGLCVSIDCDLYFSLVLKE